MLKPLCCQVLNRDGVTDIRDFNIWNKNKFVSSPLSAINTGATINIASSREPRAALGDTGLPSDALLSNKTVAFPVQVMQSRHESFLLPGGSQVVSDTPGLTRSAAVLGHATDDAGGRFLVQMHRDDYYAKYFRADKQRRSKDRDSEVMLIDGVMAEFVQPD